MNTEELQDHFLKHGPPVQETANTRNAPFVDKLLGDQKPYSIEQLRNLEKYKIKGRFSGKWYEFETTTQFVANGLIEQCERLYEEANCVECEPPKDGETCIELTDRRRL